MENLFVMLFLISLVLFVVGLINPLWVPLFISKELKTRKRVATVYGIAIVVFFFSVGITAPRSKFESTFNALKPTKTPEVQETKKPSPIKPSVIPTTTSDDPCKQYYGTDKAQWCFQMQYAMQKGQALQHRLNAKVTYDASSLYITNQESTEWDQCEATLDETDPGADNYASDGFFLKAGETQRLGWGTFVNNENQRFNYYQTKPSSVALDCMVGGKTDPKTGGMSGGEEHRSVFTL